MDSTGSEKKTHGAKSINWYLGLFFVYTYYFGLILLICRCLSCNFLFSVLYSHKSFNGCLIYFDMLIWTEICKRIDRKQKRKNIKWHTHHTLNKQPLLIHKTQVITCTIPNWQAKFDIVWVFRVLSFTMSSRTESLLIFISNLFNPPRCFGINGNVSMSEWTNDCVYVFFCYFFFRIWCVCFAVRMAITE